MSLTGNPHQSRIILRDGPLDGEFREIGQTIATYGRYFAPVPSDYPDPMGSLDGYPTRKLEVAMYERRLMGDGRVGTCEERYWYEWRYTGSEWR